METNFGLGTRNEEAEKNKKGKLEEKKVEIEKEENGN